MREIVMTDVAGVNPEALDASLRAALGATVKGISLRRGQVIVHLAAEASPQQVASARSLVQRHDPQQLSQEQQEQKQREQQIKAAHEDALAARQSATGGADISEQVALLTRRIDWLEKALEALAAGAKLAG